MKILVIEDDQTIADFMLRGLRDAGFIAHHACEGCSGLDMALSDEYNLGIFDIMLPGVDGLSIIEAMRAQNKNMPVIILSAKRSIDDRIKGLEVGGDDYLTKPFSFSELLARVQAHLRRANNTTESGTLTCHDLVVNLFARTVFRNKTRIDLQPKEFVLLEYLMRNEGHIMSRTVITERVWNYNFDPRTNVVEARISKLREKVDKGFAYPLIHTVRGLGYVLERRYD